MKVAILLLALLLGLAVFFISVLSLNLTGVDVTSRGAKLGMQTLSEVLVFLLPALLSVWLCDGSLSQLFGVRIRHSRWQFFVGGLVVWGTSLTIVSVLTSWNESLHFPVSMQALEQTLRAFSESSEREIESLLSGRGLDSLMYALLAVAVVPAVCEEFFFRGALQNFVRQWWGNEHVAVWLTAVIFSVAHGDVFGFLPRMAMGALLGYLYFRSGTIWVNTLVHCMNNGVLVLCYMLLPHDGQLFHALIENKVGIPWWLILLSCVCLAAVYCGVFLRGKNSDQVEVR